MFALIAAFGATFGVMALMLSLAGRLSAETLAVALLLLVLGFIVVLFSTDSLRARPVGGGSGFQLFTRRHARRWPLPAVLLLSLLAVAYMAFRPPSVPVAGTPAPGITTDAVVPPVATEAGNDRPPTAADAAAPPGPAPAAPPTASAPASAPANDPAAEVAALVETWRSAWAARDVTGYLDTYAPDFRPADGSTHDTWAAQRRDRLRNARGLTVRVERLDIRVDGDRATARFQQHYRAGSLDDKTTKRLVLVRGAGGWKIREEVVEATGRP